MGQLIAMPGDQCDDVRLLLPWHVTGTLDAQDTSVVERHLPHCPACRAALADERRLANLVVADAGSASDGWRSFAGRLENEVSASIAGPAPGRTRRAARHQRRRASPTLRLRRNPYVLRWVVAAQAAALLVLGVMTFAPYQRPAAYRALGETAAGNVRGGNTLAMFRPDLSEEMMRQALARAGARVVDGPTSAGAYVLEVPGGPWGEPLKLLRAQTGVTMAEPIDGGAVE